MRFASVTSASFQSNLEVFNITNVFIGTDTALKSINFCSLIEIVQSVTQVPYVMKMSLTILIKTKNTKHMTYHYKIHSYKTFHYFLRIFMYIPTSFTKSALPSQIVFTYSPILHCYTHFVQTNCSYK